MKAWIGRLVMAAVMLGGLETCRADGGTAAKGYVSAALHCDGSIWLPFSDASYNAVRRTLWICFADGGEYVYRDVPPVCFEKFARAVSKGAFFNRYIRPYYAAKQRHARIGPCWRTPGKRVKPSTT